jgi:hypothetical protein
MLPGRVVLVLLVGCGGKLAIGQVRVGGRDVSTLVVGGASGLAGTRSSSMQAGPVRCPSSAAGSTDSWRYRGPILNTLSLSRALANGGWRCSAPW